jgi:hypothetical protein
VRYLGHEKYTAFYITTYSDAKKPVRISRSIACARCGQFWGRCINAERFNEQEYKMMIRSDIGDSVVVKSGVIDPDLGIDIGG